MQKSTTAFLVSCVAKKRSYECQARDLYVSSWCVKARAYAEATGSPWFILSAEHGLVSPGTSLAPYERTLNAMKIDERRAWAERVARDLLMTLPDLSHVVFLAGKRYREFLAQDLESRGVVHTVPMNGLGIGKQLRWLGTHEPQGQLAASEA